MRQMILNNPIKTYCLQVILVLVLIAPIVKGYSDNYYLQAAYALAVVAFLVIYYITGDLKRHAVWLEANFGVFICLVFSVTILILEYIVYQGGLLGKLTIIGEDGIGDSNAIRNYFLISVASAGAPFLVWRAIIASRNTQIANHVANTNRKNQITQTYSTAIEQLGSTYSNDKPNTETRLGAIYTLEKIALSNKDYYQSIIEILVSYVRQNSPNKKDKNEKISITIQTISTVIKRIKAVFGKEIELIDLNNCNLRGADLKGADLRGAYFWDADLRYSDLRDSNLRGANLRGADLMLADLRGADLRGSYLWDADLRDADLGGADLKDANLTNADFRDTRLWDADLTDITISNKTIFPDHYKDEVKNVSIKEFMTIIK